MKGNDRHPSRKMPAVVFVVAVVFVAFAFAAANVATAFTAVPATSRTTATTTTTRAAISRRPPSTSTASFELSAKKKKKKGAGKSRGFGSTGGGVVSDGEEGVGGAGVATTTTTPPPQQQREQATSATAASSTSPPSPMNVAASASVDAGGETTTTTTTTTMTAGQRALERMRRERAEQKDEELRRVREMLRADKQVEQSTAAIPERVARRMGARMLPFVGLPLLLGMGTFVGFWYMATYRNVEFQPALVAASTILVLVVGLLGITYSVVSASWDADREGSFLGLDEFKRNVDNIRDGLGRSRENALLREKMAGLSEDELGRALSDLERRERREAKKSDQRQSLGKKLKNELE